MTYLALYLLAVLAIFAVPHRLDGRGFGRMNAFQGFASAGAVASFGLLNFRLVDWYYAPVERYDARIRRDILFLTPVFVAWGAAIAGVGHFVAKRVRRSKQDHTA